MTLSPLAPAELEQRLRAGNAVVLDVREPREFGREHVPGSLSVPLVNVAKWAKQVVPAAASLVIVAEPDEDDEDDEGSSAVPEEVAAAMAQLAEAGFAVAQQVAGYLAGGIEAYSDAGFATAQLSHVGARAIAEKLGPEARIVDVRRADEFEQGKLPGAENHPLEEYPALREALQGESRQVLLVCRLGNRSATAASLLMRDETLPGKQLHNLIGGYNAWQTIHGA